MKKLFPGWEAATSAKKNETATEQAHITAHRKPRNCLWIFFLLKNHLLSVSYTVTKEKVIWGHLFYIFSNTF